MPHPVDVHVGNKLRQMRRLRRMTQSELGSQLSGGRGVGFQQIQKYEVGSNRISASRMFELAKILRVPTDYFFADLEPTEKPAADFTGSVGKSISDLTTSQIRTVLRESYPDLQDRLVQLVRLVLNERAKFALLPIPNEPDALKEYRKEEDFLRTMEAGLISIHQDMPPLTSDAITEDDAKKIKDQLAKLVGLANQTIFYLDSDKGTYGGLYKIGLISAVAALLSTIPGVTFLTGATLPTLVFGAQTFNLNVTRDD